MSVEDATSSTNPVVDPRLLEDLRCPLGLERLVLVGQQLYCYACRKAYRIEHGIPVMLVEEAADIPEHEIPEEHQRG